MPSKPMKTGPEVRPTPTLPAAAIVASGWKYMSTTCVTPPSAISASPSVAPARTVSGVTCAASADQTALRNPSSGRSSASPRKSTIAAWQWVLTRPGRRRPPPASTTSAARVPMASDAGPSAVILPSVIASAPSAISVNSASIVRMRALVMSVSARAGKTVIRVSPGGPARPGSAPASAQEVSVAAPSRPPTPRPRSSHGCRRCWPPRCWSRPRWRGREGPDGGP